MDHIKAIVLSALPDACLFFRILFYIYKRHLSSLNEQGGPQPCSILGFSSQSDVWTESQNHQWETTSLRMKAALVDLENCLRNQKGLALQIKMITPVGPYIRQTEVFPPSTKSPWKEHDAGDSAVSSKGNADPQKFIDKQGPHENSGISPGISGRCLDPIDILVELESAGDEVL